MLLALCLALETQGLLGFIFFIIDSNLLIEFYIWLWLSVFPYAKMDYVDLGFHNDCPIKMLNQLTFPIMSDLIRI